MAIETKEYTCTAYSSLRRKYELTMKQGQGQGTYARHRSGTYVVRIHQEEEQYVKQTKQKQQPEEDLESRSGWTKAIMRYGDSTHHATTIKVLSSKN